MQRVDREDALRPEGRHGASDREDASSMVTAGATANTTVKNSRASRESGLLCSHSHGESIGVRFDVFVKTGIRSDVSERHKNTSVLTSMQIKTGHC